MDTVAIASAPASVSAQNHYGQPQANSVINIFLATFAGLGLPRTLNLHAETSQSVGHVYSSVFSRLPGQVDGLVLTTVSNKQLLPNDPAPVASLLSTPEDKFISLRLSRKLCGGKGGFGSQLRAAGGRMSSRKNRDRQENTNGSNRNLDGRRLRTVDEAKKLAEYLAIKPEMEQREKDTRKKRWEAIVSAAEKREEDIKSGRSGANQGRLDPEYVESKELAEEKTREAIMKAMKEDMMDLEHAGSESSQDAAQNSDAEEVESSTSSESAEEESGPSNMGGMSFYGWDDEDEDDEDDEDEVKELEGSAQDTQSQHLDKEVYNSGQPDVSYIGKGKSKVLSD